MTFANGLTVSVQFGERNYCDNRRQNGDCRTCENAEIAVWNDQSDGYLFADGTSPQSDTGWKTPDEIARAMAIIATFDKDIESKDAIPQIHEAFKQAEITPA